MPRVPKMPGKPGRPPKIENPEVQAEFHVSDKSPSEFHRTRPKHPAFMGANPVADIFGSDNSGIYQSPEDDSGAPPELLEAFGELGLDEKSYTCMLKEVSHNATNNTTLKNFTNEYPSTEWITYMYGPGEYKLVFFWRQKNPETQRMENQSKTITVVISDKLMDDYTDFQMKLRVIRAKKRKQLLRDLKMDQKMEAGLDDILDDEDSEPKKNEDPLDAGKRFIEQAVETNRLLGLSRGSIEWDKFLPIIGTGVAGAIKLFTESRSNKSDFMEKLLMLMLTQNQNANSQLVEVFKASQGQGSGVNAVKEFKDMIFGALDIKEALKGEPKETIADRLFNMIEAVAPQILMIAAQGQQARQQNPTIRKAVENAQGFVNQNPDFQAMKEDPKIRDEVIARLDAFYGWEQTDQIIEVAGIVRPETCPRLDNQKYAAGDPRNGAQEAEIDESPDGERGME